MAHKVTKGSGALTRKLKALALTCKFTKRSIRMDKRIMTHQMRSFSAVIECKPLG